MALSRATPAQPNRCRPRKVRHLRLRPLMGSKYFGKAVAYDQTPVWLLRKPSRALHGPPRSAQTDQRISLIPQVGSSPNSAGVKPVRAGSWLWHRVVQIEEIGRISQPCRDDRGRITSTGTTRWDTQFDQPS